MTNNDFDAQEFIFRFERACDPFKYQVGGICIWPVFRFTVWENLKSNADKLTKRQSLTGQTKLSRVSSYKNVIKEMPAVWNLLLKKKKYDVALMTTTNRLRDKTADGYRNIYFDYFEPRLKNVLYIYADSKQDRTPASQPSIFFSNKAAFPAIVKRKIFGSEQASEVRLLYSDLKRFLEENGCAEYLDVPLPVWERMYTIFLSKSELLTKLFRAIESKLFIVDCAYGKEWAMAAAKHAGVPVYELQHGIPQGNIAYFYDPDTVGEYRERLPVPDKIMTFGDYFSESLSKNNIWGPGDMLNVGMARLEQYRRGFEYIRPRSREKIRVLITSQWIVSDRIAEFLKDVIDEFPPNVTVSIKPHPSERHVNPYQVLGDSVEIVDRDEDFYKLLSGCHIHCSTFSTTLLESLGMGIPTVILGLPGSEHVIPVTERGYCKVAKTPGELASIIEDSAGGGNYLDDWHKNTKKNRSYFWEPNASENLQKIIERIVRA